MMDNKQDDVSKEQKTEEQLPLSAHSQLGADREIDANAQGEAITAADVMDMPSDNLEQDNTANLWQKMSDEQLEQLDDFSREEYEELNQIEEQEHRHGSMPILSGCIWVVVLLAMTLYFCLPALNLSKLDLSFVAESTVLSQDELVQQLRPAVVTITSGTQSGTGFNISDDGIIVTNKHVIDNILVDNAADRKKIIIGFPDGRLAFAEDIVLISDYDLALIKLVGQDYPCVALGQQPLQAGDDIFTIGNPLGFDWTVASGQVMSGIESSSETVLLRVTVYPGSSGSPVFDRTGKVAAIIYAKMGTENIAVAIPVEILKKYI